LDDAYAELASAKQKLLDTDLPELACAEADVPLKKNLYDLERSLGIF
jgi:hypothetical protein